MVPLAFLVVLVAALLPLALIAFQRARVAGQHGIRPSLPVVIAALMPMASFFFLTVGGPDGEVLGVLAGLAFLGLFGYLWVREFVGLMAMADDAFPGRRDKLVWIALMVLLPPVGLVSFATFRRAYWPAEKPAVDASAQEWA